MIKALLLVLAFLSLGSALRHRNTVRFQAGKKLLLLLFIMLLVVAVAQPDRVTEVANAVGVGRGADLVLYVLVMAFLFVVLNVYFKFKDADVRETRLVRALAIAEARLSALEQASSAADARQRPEDGPRVVTRP